MDQPVYTLHYFPFSLYSLMVRFGFVLGESLNPNTAPKLKIRLVNLHREDHLSEPYLTLVNVKGQVPVLTSPALPASSLDGSQSIALWLCKQQPELIPEEHQETISCLMDKLHALQAISFVVSAKDQQDGLPNEAAALLEKNGLSLKYRRALEINSIFHESTHSSSLDPENVADAEEMALEFMHDLVEVLKEHNRGGRWIFGDQPTILDAHVTTLAVRLMDVDRGDLLPEEVQVYARSVIATPEWYKVTSGRPTVWDDSLGKVEDFIAI
ncbi:hypothetical protein B0J13DRAFT_618105 [Dactylonectria estremocensis]|uniref:GST N-terminal domain-containing protein n=1 Tax=Dactylonectria estremocensis TaxID=1079267 RepID=A0A9P9FA23_9HYPO|nr:hypothetical protein B0J13DRAFT_618105 [Dactylonectria estremocensis]